MKSTDKQNKGMLRYLASFITDNWWLKLLALALATIIYQSLKSDLQQNERPQQRQYRTTNSGR